MSPSYSPVDGDAADQSSVQQCVEFFNSVILPGLFRKVLKQRPYAPMRVSFMAPIPAALLERPHNVQETVAQMAAKHHRRWIVTTAIRYRHVHVEMRNVFPGRKHHQA